MDRFLKDLLSECSNILELGEKIRRKKISTDKAIKEINKTLPKLLEKRFNIEYEVQDAGDAGLATLPPIGYMGSAIQMFDVDKDIVEAIEKTGFEGAIEYLDKNTQPFKDGGFIIDLKKKKIEYFGKTKFKSILLISPTFVYDAGLTPGELAAGILHEIGHDFEYINYIQFLTRKAEKTLERIKRALFTDDPVTGIIKELSIELEDKMSDVEIEQKSTGEKVALVIKLGIEVLSRDSDEYIKRHNLNHIARTGKEFEIAADNFSIDFGLGVELTSGLRKMMTYFKGVNLLNIIGLPGKIARALLPRKGDNAEIIIRSIIRIYVNFLLAAVMIAIMKEVVGHLSDGQKKILYNVIVPIARFIRKIDDALDALRFYKVVISAVLRLTSNPTSTTWLIAGIGTAGIAIKIFNDYLENYTEDGYLAFPYEDITERFDAVKRRIIEDLKQVDDPELKLELVDKIKQVEREIEEVKKHTNSLILYISTPTPIDINKMSPMYILDRIIRVLVNNDLYVKSEELRQLTGS